ncbi:hypothetical protein JW916_04130 [Candidatus Sumerlaeota bacterium]|nr:hypothetical protein [Candidatus Sumerlaeota bacterium]
MNPSSNENDNPKPRGESSGWRSGEAAASRAILLIGGSTPEGVAPCETAALCEAVARVGDRIAIQLERDAEQAARLAARVASRGSLVLPLEMPLRSGVDVRQALVGRVVEDFARIDLVLYAARGAKGSTDKAKGESAARDLARWAEASEPVLRKARPTGHFLVVVSASEDASLAARLLREVERIARAWEGKKLRACVNLLDFRPGGPKEAECAAFLDRLAGLRVSGRRLTIDSI